MSRLIDGQVVPLSDVDSGRALTRFGALPTTHAVPLLELSATEEQWLQARRRVPLTDVWRIGASELAAVLGLSSYASPFSLWWSKQDGWAHAERTMGQRLGHEFEDIIGRLWAEQNPAAMLCRPGFALFGHPFVPWMVCTPDFLAVVETEMQSTGEGLQTLALGIEPVECKSDEGGKGWGKPGTDEVPEHHRVQVYVQCEVLGARRGHLMRLAGKRPAAYVLPYDDAARARMQGWIMAGTEFVRSLIDDVAPDLDGHKATTEALQLIHGTYVKDKRVELDPGLIAEFLNIDEVFKKVTAERDEIRNWIRAALCDAQIGTDPLGKPVVKRNIYKRSGYEVGPSMVDEIRRMS